MMDFKHVLNDGLQVSRFRFYSMGVVAKNKRLSSKKIYVTPIEDLSMYDGELNGKEEVIEQAGEDAKGKKYTSKVSASNTIIARWLSLSVSNRLTAPDVRVGEMVVVYQYGDHNRYYWTTMSEDISLRKLETAVFAFSGTPNEDEKLTADNCYYLEVSSHKKLVKFHMSKANGEACGFDMVFDGGKGNITIDDTKGNGILWDANSSVLSLNFTSVNVKGDLSAEGNIGGASVNASDTVSAGTLVTAPKLAGILVGPGDGGGSGGDGKPRDPNAAPPGNPYTGAPPDGYNSGGSDNFTETVAAAEAKLGRPLTQEESAAAAAGNFDFTTATIIPARPITNGGTDPLGDKIAREEAFLGRPLTQDERIGVFLGNYQLQAPAPAPPPVPTASNNPLADKIAREESIIGRPLTADERLNVFLGTHSFAPVPPTYKPDTPLTGIPANPLGDRIDAAQSQLGRELTADERLDVFLGVFPATPAQTQQITVSKLSMGRIISDYERSAILIGCQVLRLDGNKVNIIVPYTDKYGNYLTPVQKDYYTDSEGNRVFTIQATTPTTVGVNSANQTLYENIPTSPLIYTDKFGNPLDKVYIFSENEKIVANGIVKDKAVTTINQITYTDNPIPSNRNTMRIIVRGSPNDPGKPESLPTSGNYTSNY